MPDDDRDQICAVQVVTVGSLLICALIFLLWCEHVLSPPYTLMYEMFLELTCASRLQLFHVGFSLVKLGLCG